MARPPNSADASAVDITDEPTAPEDDPEHVVCTFVGGGTLHDYTMMDAMVALTASYSAAGKSIEFTHLKSGSVKMLKKASHCSQPTASSAAAAETSHSPDSTWLAAWPLQR